MNKNLIAYLISIFSFTSAIGQTTFQKAYGGTAMDEGKSVKQTTDGGYIMAGTTTSFGSGGYDMLVIKTNTIGDTIWTKSFGGSTDNEYGFCIQQTNDGGYIVSGVASSFFDVSGDMYIIKLKANGDTTWTRTYGGIGYEWGANIQQTSDGGYIVVGQTPAYGAGGFDAYLVKLNSNGNIVWTKTYGGSGLEIGSSVDQTTDGGYILTGQIDTYGAGGGDFYLVKTDATGNVAWTKAYGQSGTEAGVSVKQTLDGGYIICGTSENALGPLGPDMCLVKTNSVGDTLWAKLYGGPMIDEGYEVNQTADGGYIMVGKSFSFSTAGDYDVYVVKVNGQGDVQWSKTYGGSGASSNNEIGYSINQTSDGGYVIVGESTLGFGVGLKNIYLIKTDSLGNSGCYQSTPSTITTNLLPQVISPPNLIFSGGDMTMPETMVNSGTAITNLCSSAPSAINEMPNDFAISIYPNPFYNEVSISVEADIQINTIKIYNLLGQEIYLKSDYSKSTVQSNITLDLKDFNSGIYFCELQADGFQRVIKLLKRD
ncbi:MAG: T9SS type A sorting domain-containing protein [Bacteroidetes bacterium]|nr:T9SS type A sorting domain-containing protein [Bacteroidota bacterium]